MKKSKNTPIAVIIFAVLGLLLLLVVLYFGYNLGRKEAVNDSTSLSILVDEESSEYVQNHQVIDAEENPNTIPETTNDYSDENVRIDFVYTNKELGFSLTLPHEYLGLVTEVNLSSSDLPDSSSVDFMFNVKCLENMDGRIYCGEQIFNITKFSPGADITQHGPGGRKILTTTDGSQFYLYHPMAVGIDSNDPLYDEFITLSDWDKVYGLVKKGLKEL